MNNKAFSLVESSVVILIIGILIAGIATSNRIVRDSRLQSARSLTKGSPVSSINGLIGWWETTLEESFGGAEPDQDLDGGTGGITTWHDTNPQSTIKNNATSSSTTNNPGYNKSGINNLPTLQFNGSSHFLNYDGSLLANSNYSIFIVEARSSSGSANYMIGSSNATSSANRLLHVGYRDDVTFTWAQYANDPNVTVPSYSAPTPRIHALVFISSATTPKRIFMNGAEQTYYGGSPTPVPSQGLLSYTNAAFGRFIPFANAYYQGNIGEIIMFNRGLNDDDRRSVEEYLAKKWNITISQP